MAGQLGFHRLPVPHQKHAHVVVPRRLDRTFDLWLGGAVGAHRVQSYDAWHGLLKA